MPAVQFFDEGVKIAPLLRPGDDDGVARAMPDAVAAEVPGADPARIGKVIIYGGNRTVTIGTFARSGQPIRQLCLIGPDPRIVAKMKKGG